MSHKVLSLNDEICSFLTALALALNNRGSLPTYDFLNVRLTEEHVRRLLNGNGIDQVGLLQFISESKSTVDLREILGVLAQCSDILKNQNFEVF